MKEISAIKYVENKSRFYAHHYKIHSESDITQILKTHRTKYKKANHHCYAAILGKKEIFKDDGEVGHPGRVLLEVTKNNNLHSDLIVVSRVFGGIKLGVGGVSRAFRKAANYLFDEKK